MGNNADIIAIFGNSDSESDDNELTQKCVKRKKSTETIDRSDSNLISEKESSIESRKFEKINELDNRLSKGSELELEKNELNEKTSSTNSVSPLTISNGDLMMMFVSAVKNLNLDGKTEKANALDHIAPVVLEIMRIAMKKVQANEEVDVGALITEQVRNFLDTDRHNVERLTLCTDVIIPLVQSVILKIRVHDYYDYYEEKNSNKTACKKYSKEEIEKKCLDSKMNKLKRICEERKRKAAEDETNQEESISNVNDKIHQKIISQQDSIESPLAKRVKEMKKNLLQRNVDRSYASERTNAHFEIIDKSNVNERTINLQFNEKSQESENISIVNNGITS